MIDSQRDNTKMTHELVGCRAESEELRRKLMAMELNFKEKLEKCKEKFSVENDKLFQRYEK